MTNRCAKTAVLFCLLPFFIVAETVVLEPGQDKRKAVPIPQEKRTVDLYLTAEFPWSIRDSWIEQKDDLSLWMRKNKTYYKLSNAYAPNSFVVIKGELQKPGRGNGVPPVARLSVPAIDLSWDFDCGIASRENLEHQTPAALLVTTDATQHRNLLVTLREKSNAALIVQLFWTDTRSVRVYRDNIPIWSGSYQTIDGETAFRVEPVAVSESEITFTAKTLPDDYGHTMAIDLVKAFTYDLIVDGVKFNHTLNSSHDGIEIRRNYSQGFSIPNGEWTAADGALAPVCYRMSQDITVKARFRTNSAFLSSASISAEGIESDEGWTFGTFNGRTVTFSGGVSPELEFTMQGAAPSAVGIFEKPRIAWLIQDINGNGDAVLEAARTGPHKTYAILDTPVAPWTGETAGSNQNPLDERAGIGVLVGEGEDGGNRCRLAGDPRHQRKQSICI
ncbi:MAG: hypothetical protein IKR48_08570 [Kiritimatiellae bacterium]|nr:hypothetical protein [Kiritimatiellia bacterium]